MVVRAHCLNRFQLQNVTNGTKQLRDGMGRKRRHISYKCCIIINYPKCSNLKQRKFIVPISAGQKSRHNMARFSAQSLRGLKSGSTGAKHSSGAPLPAHGLWLNSVPSAEQSKRLSFASYQPGAAQLLEATVSPVLRPHPNSKVSIRIPPRGILVILGI